MKRIQALVRLASRRESPQPALSGISGRGKSTATAHAFSFTVEPAREHEIEAGPSAPPRGPTPPGNSLHRAKPSTKGKERERVVFRYEDAGVSAEKRTFFAGEEIGGEVGMEPGVWADAAGESILGLEPGRVVEVRRSGNSAIGLLLASVIANGRQRLILLRQSGEIWPISPNDVQFIMPPSLVPSALAEKCWSPDLIEAWAKGDESVHHESADGEMMAARREAVVILRKVGKETEKMIGRLSSGSQGGVSGMDGVWEEVVSGKGEDERGRVTAAEAAEILLSSAEGSRSVKANTLPAYAAHTMLMDRPDLFVADEVDMWSSGVFLVRSRAERERLQTVERWVAGTTPEDRQTLQSFVDKCRAALASFNPSPVEWSPTDRTLISNLFLRLYESRSTQHSPSDRLSIAILRAIDPYPGVIADQASIARLLTDLGLLPISDSLFTSKSIETVSREMSQSGIAQSLLPGDLFKGTELDTLREDFSSHTVWVIDDPTAKELDDGISLTPVEGTEDVWVHIHIADPTKILPLDHPLSIQASFRGTALYMPEGNTPLMPLGDLSAGLSLDAADGEEGSGVMTFCALLSSSGEIKDTAVKLGWIKKARLTSYADVDAAFGVPRLPSIRPFGPVRPDSEEPVEAPSRPPISPAEISQLDLLRKIATARRARRLQSAGLEWALSLGTPSLISPPPPTHNIFAPSSIASHSTPLPSFPLIDYTIPSPPPASMTSSAAVAEMMMLAGRVAAIFCSTNSIPVPYRSAAEPQQLHIPGQPRSTMSVEDLLSHRRPDGSIDPFIVWQSRVVFPPSTVGTTPLPHWNMGLTGPEAGYTRPTSPLRRYDDFLVHWQMKSFLAKRAGLAWGKALDEPEMEGMIQRVKGAQSRGKRAMNTAGMYWQAGLFGQRLAHPRDVEGEGEVDLREPLEARIAGPSVAMRGMMTTPVHIPALGAMARLTSAKGWEIGEEVQVRMVSAAQWPAPFVAVVPV